MSIQPLNNFDEEIIKKAKKYAEIRDLYTLSAVVQTFEKTKDVNYKIELFDLIKLMLNDIETLDKEIEDWRASQKATA